MFFYKHLFYKQNLVEIKSEIVTISSIKRIQKKKNNLKKNLLSKELLQNSYLINQKQCSPLFQKPPPLYGLTPLPPPPPTGPLPSITFSKIPTPPVYISGGGRGGSSHYVFSSCILFDGKIKLTSY